tara:strand:+ start:461 stop:706 length:246 start_codon:yes stop_codon:yes gene_type:complete
MPNLDIEIEPVQIMKSMTSNDRDKPLKPINVSIKITKIKELSIFALIIFIISQTLVYRHMPRYKAKALNENIFTNRNEKII